MTDIEKCKACQYWRTLNPAWRDNENWNACHVLLDTGKCRVEKDGECLSFNPKTR